MVMVSRFLCFTLKIIKVITGLQHLPIQELSIIPVCLSIMRYKLTQITPKIISYIPFIQINVKNNPFQTEPTFDVFVVNFVAFS